MTWRNALSKNLQELRIHLCQSSGGSAGARDFVMGMYHELKKANPTFPILIRECAGIEARMVARYDFGKETAVQIEGMAKDDIAKQLEHLVKQGEKLPRSTESA